MWLYVPPSTSSLSARESAASNSEPHELSKGSAFWLAQCVSWRGNSIRLQSLRSKWKKELWTRLLSGVTSKPSTRRAGVARFIASLRGSPANHFPSPVNNSQKKTPGTFGLTCSACSKIAAQGLLFLKMSPASCGKACSKSSKTFRPRVRCGMGLFQRCRGGRASLAGKTLHICLLQRRRATAAL